MPAGEGKSPPRIAEKQPRIEKSRFKVLFAKLRKRRILETLAAFVGGGWLLIEVVERLLVGHYGFPTESIDLTVISVIGALLATLVWRCFGGTDKRPGNIKVEVLLVPLIILAALSIDLMILLEILGISGKTLLTAAVAVCLGIGWILLKSLQWAATGTSTASTSAIVHAEPPVAFVVDKSIIVLPFANISPEEGQEYFCDGMTEEIITDLSHVHDLLVISRSSAMTFKGAKKTIPEISRAVNVRYVLEGSVRKAGNNLRITAQLIDSATDAHLWAEKYSGTLDDVFDIQEKVSRAIVDTLRLKLTPEQNHRINEKHIPDVVAYEYYLQAKRDIWSFNQEILDRALRLANQALGIVGENALLYATVAIICWQYHNAGFRLDEDMLGQADTAAGKALELDPALSQGYVAKGAIAYTRGDLQAAARHYKRAAEFEAGGEALAWLSVIHALAGRIPEARRYGDHAVGVDPLNILALCFRGLIEIYGGDFKSACGWLQKGLDVMPNDPMTKGFCALALLYAGKRDQSMALFDQMINAEAGLLSSLGALWKAALNADGQAVRKVANDLHAYARRDKEFSWMLADCFALIGESEEAFDWLANSIEMGLINNLFFSEFDPFLAPLTGNKRFQALMERAREKERRFEV